MLRDVLVDPFMGGIVGLNLRLETEMGELGILPSLDLGMNLTLLLLLVA